MRRIDDDNTAPDGSNEAGGANQTGQAYAAPLENGADRAASAPFEPGVVGPRHVAIIMDGNGRWAAARRLPRIAGHRRGVEAVRAVVEACPDFGVEYLTLFAFSTENWKRPAAEVAGLMQLFRHYLRREAAQLNRDGVRVRFIGDSGPLPPDISQMMQSLEETTRHNVRLTVSIAINYGARSEMARAAQRLAAKVAAGEISPADVDERAFGRELLTDGLPDPDLIIRTSGEQRLSNFLLWQAAYSEFVFAPENWPDFGRDEFARALAQFGTRERRYGTVAG